MNAVPIPQVDIVDCLSKQNLYQRLGLKTNVVSRGELESAYNARIALLENCHAELTAEGMIQARHLLDEAISTLRHPVARTEYDERLMALKKIASSKPRTDNPADPDRFASRYSLQHLLSDGQRCKVYSAMDNHLKRRVIVKRIQPDLLARRDHRELFQREAKIFASSNSSNLVKILDFDEQSGSIVVEKMSRNLSQEMQDRVCEIEEVVEILRDALNGLVTLHNQGIAHGRIESGHLYYDDSGRVKLSLTPGMAGISTTLRPGPDTRHVAPELLNARVFGPAGLPADIYMLGFLAIELLCGKSLAGMVNPAIEASGENNNGWLLWHASATDTLPPIASLLPALPRDFEQLLTRMTCKKQQERIGNAKDCLAALRQKPFESSSPRVNPMEVNRPAVVDGIEMLGGLPPALHEEYQVSQVIQWKDILSQPKLLFQTEARTKLLTVAMGSLATAATALLILGGSQQPVEIADRDSRTPAPAEMEILDHPIDLEPDPGPKESEIDTSKVSTPPAESWEATSNWNDLTESEVESDELSYVDAGVQETTASESIGSLATTHRSSSKTVSPADYSSLYPAHPAFEILGAENSHRALRQYEAIMNALDMIQENGKRPFRGPFPFSFDDTQVVDPRASFELACLSYQKGDFSRAEKYCRKSLEDGKELAAPYVIPLIFLSHLLVERAEYSQSIVCCQKVLGWNLQQWKDCSDERYREAAAAVAWWMGILVGFVEDAKGSSIASSVDTQEADRFIQSLSGFEPVLLEKYNFARSTVVQRFRELSALRYSTDQQPGWLTSNAATSPPGLPLSLSTSNDFQGLGSDREVSINSSSPDEFGTWEMQDASSGSGLHRETETNRRVDPRVSSPLRLRSYHSLDLCALAEQTRSTLRHPSIRQANLTTQSVRPVHLQEAEGLHEFASRDVQDRKVVKSW